ncbi:MAG: GlxA family transcriptional regulator [Ectothiorhodospiraceae bacterium AqS1]|nr:GlxA family transcriptional regulator [Ectothiorhodospiraceae bacterium AqS1]
MIEHPPPSIAHLREGRPQEVVFVLIPEYSLIAFSCALEPLRMANRLSRKPLYRWRIVSDGGEAVVGSNGLSIEVDGSIDSVIRADLVLICAGERAQNHSSPKLIAWLQRLAWQRIALGGVCTGTLLLARAGLLGGYRCTIHWENLASLREEYPHAIISSELFEIDRDRYTCSGGVAPLDMMLNLLEARHGHRLAAMISEEFICERIRRRNDRQRTPLKAHLGTSQPKLVEAISLMEANLMEPMNLDELASHVGFSRRQLERLFQRHIHCAPRRYYLELRLDRARQLLQQTAMPITHVALACGFVSPAHFSKCYRSVYGLSPKDERRLRLPAVNISWLSGEEGEAAETTRDAFFDDSPQDSPQKDEPDFISHPARPFPDS